nr:immunoglobulin light chain junction region [Macaca mulatta]
CGTWDNSRSGHWMF